MLQIDSFLGYLSTASRSLCDVDEFELMPLLGSRESFDLPLHRSVCERFDMIVNPAPCFTSEPTPGRVEEDSESGSGEDDGLEGH